jgi:F0F1-type ATP synthase assembly protein I
MAKNSSKVEHARSRKDPSGVFVGMALDMSWRLAVVVLVPIIGGFELDKAFNTSPLLVIVGFVLAMLGMALVMKQTVDAANDMPLPTVVKPTETNHNAAKAAKEKKA